MKTRYGFLLLIPLALLAVSCPMPSSPTAGTAAPAAEQPALLPSFSVETDASRGLAVFVDESGARIDITSIDEDGSVVPCVEPLASAAMADETSAKGFGRHPVLVIGLRRDGRPGAWIVMPDNTVQPVIDAESGKLSTDLPESDEKAGVFRGRFGWLYHVRGVSEDGKLIAGYAEHPRGFGHGRWQIDAGTTIGVYWRVWKHSVRPYWVVSHARVIGSYDASNVPVPDRRERHWRDWRRRRLDELKWFFLDYLTSYLVMVEKGGVHNDTASEAYLVTGTDQDGEAAVATIAKDGSISIAPASPPSTEPDLAPGAMTLALSGAADGTSLDVALRVNNLQSAAVSSAFDVDYYLGLSSAFSPAGDTKLGSVSHPGGIAASSGADISVSLALPDALDLNQAVYIYAVVDAGGAVAETDEANNISTVAAAAQVLLYDDENSARTYPVVLQTYSPSGASSADTLMALYRQDGGAAVFLAGVNMMGPGPGYASIDTSGTPLGPGTYHVVVMSWSPQQRALRDRHDNGRNHQGVVRGPGVQLPGHLGARRLAEHMATDDKQARTGSAGSPHGRKRAEQVLRQSRLRLVHVRPAIEVRLAQYAEGRPRGGGPSRFAATVRRPVSAQNGPNPVATANSRKAIETRNMIPCRGSVQRIHFG